MSRTSLTSSKQSCLTALFFRVRILFCQAHLYAVKLYRVKSIIAFIGVRISCAICDINSVLAAFALLASSAIAIQLCSRRLLALIICVTYKTSVIVFDSFRRLTINLAVCQLLSFVRYSVAIVSSFLNASVMLKCQKLA